MEKITIKNQNYLITFLYSHRFNYTVINDGFDVIIKVNSLQEVFNIGKMFGDYLTNVKSERKDIIAILKDNQVNYDMGIITADQYNAVITACK